MPTVRISSNFRNIGKMELAGTPELKKDGTIERSLDMPEPVYQEIEKAIAKGINEGSIQLAGGTRVRWFVDR